MTIFRLSLLVIVLAACGSQQTSPSVVDSASSINADTVKKENEFSMPVND
ncbi:MAG: hypothetical protein ACRBBR_07990 [Cellvibrionaceae bacterium]